MALRERLATSVMSSARSFGRLLGCETKIELSQHSIETKMVIPTTTDDMAWDPDMYKRGNVFLKGYANPIKPTKNHNVGIDDPDQADIQTDEEHTSLISSPRYRLYMVQDLVSQLLNPAERLKLISYALIGVAVILAMTLVLTLLIASNVGVF